MLCNFLRNREKIADSLSILATEILLITVYVYDICLFFYDEKNFGILIFYISAPQNILELQDVTVC